MAHVKDHIEDCKHFLGKGWNEIHSWLDMCTHLFPIATFDGYHRTFRHNSYGIEYGRIMGCEDAVRIHIARDYREGEIQSMNLKVVRELSNKALTYFHNFENMAPGIHPYIVEAWKLGAKGLVAMAKEE